MHVSNDIDRVKSEIENLSHWSSTDNLTLNVAKTTGLIYYRGSFKDDCDIESHLSCVCFQHSVRFLGVLLMTVLAGRAM